jgi:hypothetical protein
VPLYSQLYIYDPLEGLEHQHNNNPQTQGKTMAFLQDLLHNCNPFVNIYEQAAVLTHSCSLPAYHLKLDLLEASDCWCYNLPTTHHVLAVIIPGDVDTCINLRSIIICKKGGPLIHDSSFLHCITFSSTCSYWEIWLAQGTPLHIF